MTAAAQVWGMSEVDFLLMYGMAVVMLAVFWVVLSGGSGQDEDAHVDLDVHELAMLSGGPRLAITVAAAALRRDGLLDAGPGSALTAAGELPAGAHVIQREVFDAVRRTPQLSGGELRHQLRDSDPLKRAQDALLQRGLRLQGHAPGLARVLWCIGALLWLVALARVAAVLLGDVQGEVTAATWVLLPALGIAYKQGLTHRPRHGQSARGRSLLSHLRDTRALLRHSPRNDVPLAAALFGAAILWDADPDLAQALGVLQTSWDWDSFGGDGWGGGGDGGCGGGCGG